MNRFNKHTKRKFYSFFLLPLGLFVISFQSFCQKKVEIEIAISTDSVPQISRDLIHQLFKEQKVSWYFEKSEDESTYEAKIKANKKLYSVEFSNNGVFQDAEVLIKKKDLPKAVINTINEKLSETFQKSEFKKIQKQYLNKSDLISVLNEKKFNDIKNSLKVNYEIIIFGQNSLKQAYYEYLFDGEGVFIKKQELEDSNLDNYFY